MTFQLLSPSVKKVDQNLVFMIYYYYTINFTGDIMEKISSLFMTIIVLFTTAFSSLFGIPFSHTYNVGINEKYTTINQALNEWKKDGYPKATVNIANGRYNEKIFVDSGHEISFIGESRDGVIITTHTGNYEDAPIFIRHGDVTIKNMTVIADHSKNKNFSYYGNSSSTRAYAIHIDGGKIPGKVVVENVTAISYQSPAFGLGLIPGSTIRIENCDSISYTDKTYKNVPVGMALTYGSLLCHKSSESLYPERKKEKLELVDVNVYSKNTENALYLLSEANEDFNLLAKNITLKSGVSENGEGKFVFNNKKSESKLKLDIRSRNNSNEMLNYNKG